MTPEQHLKIGARLTATYFALLHDDAPVTDEVYRQIGAMAEQEVGFETAEAPVAEDAP